LTYTYNIGNSIDDRNSYENNDDIKNALKKLDEFNWKKTSLKIDGELRTISARYNLIKDALEIKYKGKEYELAKRNNFSFTFEDSNKTYQVKSFYADDGMIHTSYFIVDEDLKELGVFKKESFEKIDYKRERYISMRKDGIEFRKKFKYYLIDKDNRLFHLTTNRSTIRKSFPYNGSSIIKFIKKNKLSDDNNQDIIGLAKYIKVL
jgi:hypothetical protein